jgi:hypothetical protein
VKDQENIVNEGTVIAPKKGGMEEVKKLKENYNKCHELNKKLHEHIQELTSSFERDMASKVQEIQILKVALPEHQLENM